MSTIMFKMIEISLLWQGENYATSVPGDFLIEAEYTCIWTMREN